jgi:hypothetical protein
MKLLYVAIAAGLCLSNVDAKRKRLNDKQRAARCRAGIKKHCRDRKTYKVPDTCTDATSMYAEMMLSSNDGEAERQAAALAKMEHFADPDEACARAMADSAMYMQKYKGDNDVPSGDCNHEVDTICYTHLLAAICEDVEDYADPSVANVPEGGKSTGSSNDNGLGAQTSYVVAASAIMPLMPKTEETEKFNEEVHAAVDSDEEGLEAGSRSKINVKQVNKDASVVDAFKKATGGVWNVVVSGGPEYCRDMFPRFPRIIKGKINPSHPNWYGIKDVRDNCVCLLNIIKTLKCTCQYLIWGNPNTFPKISGPAHRDKFGKRYGKVCYYLSMLKGSFQRPKTVRYDPWCNNGSGNKQKEMADKQNNKPNKKPNKNNNQLLTDHGQVIPDADSTNQHLSQLIGYTGDKMTREEIERMPLDKLLELEDIDILSYRYFYIWREVAVRDKRKCMKKRGPKKKCIEQMKSNLKAKLTDLKQRIVDLLGELECPNCKLSNEQKEILANADLTVREKLVYSLLKDTTDWYANHDKGDAHMKELVQSVIAKQDWIDDLPDVPDNLLE